jgi:hypothetical protein
MPQYNAKPFNDAQKIANLNQLIKFLYTVGIEINGIDGKGACYSIELKNSEIHS